MKSILSLSLLSVIFLIGQNVQASRYWVENKTDKDQHVFFSEYIPGKFSLDYPIKSKSNDHDMLIPANGTVTRDNIDWYVEKITFNGKEYGPGSFGLKADKEVSYEPSSYSNAQAWRWEKDKALIFWNWSTGFKIINGPDGKPILKRICCPWGEY